MKIHNAVPNVNLNGNNVIQNNKKIAFSGQSTNKLISSCEKFFNLDRSGTMTRDLFVANAFVFLLGGRLISSRDKNERRETLTRDIPTIVIAVFGVKFCEKFAAKLIQLKKGFAIGENEGSHKLKVASFDQLKDWYHYDNKLANGFDGFIQRLVDKGGNLKTICSSLNENIKNKLINFKKDNVEFKNELSKDGELKEIIKKAFSVEKNNAFKQAGFWKSVPKLAGFIITLSSIGIFIPKLNIHITEKVNKKAKQKEEGIEKH